MKNLIKLFFVLLVVLTGCTYQESVVDVDTTKVSVFEVKENGENELCHDDDVDGETFKAFEIIEPTEILFEHAEYEVDVKKTISQ